MSYERRNLNGLLGSGALPGSGVLDGDLLFRTDGQPGQKLHEGTAPGTLTPVGYPYLFAPTLWDDMRVPVTATKTGGSKDPTFAQFRDDGAASQGVFSYDFSAAQEQELYFAIQLPHSYKLGTDIKPHVHWVTKTATAVGTVIWGLEYTVAIRGGAFPLTQIITGLYTFSGDVQYDHLTTSLSDIAGAGVLTAVSPMLVCRIFRDTGSDTYADAVSMLEVDFHFQKDAVGSATPEAK